MKKKLLAVAVVGALASPVAFGQTLYGIVDLGYQNAKHADGDINKDFLQQGQHSGSRLGVRGSEDLAGGTYAMYQIEFNISADNGSAAATGTQRLTIVGLGSKAWGEVTLGQQYTHHFHTIAVGSASGYATFTSAAGLVPELTRASNSIKYSSPVMGGFSVGALWGLSGGEATEPTGAGEEANYWDAAIRYTPGPFGVAVSTGKLTEEDGPDEFEVTLHQISANWDNRAFGVYANYWTGEAEETGVELGDADGWSISGVGRFGGRHELYAIYGQVEVDIPGLATKPDMDAWAIGYQHVVSKRTRFYTAFTQAKYDNGAVADFGDFGSIAPTGMVTPTITGTFNKPRAFQVGLVHTF